DAHRYEAAPSVQRHETRVDDECRRACHRCRKRKTHSGRGEEQATEREILDVRGLAGAPHGYGEDGGSVECYDDPAGIHNLNALQAKVSPPPDPMLTMMSPCLSSPLRQLTSMAMPMAADPVYP